MFDMLIPSSRKLFKERRFEQERIRLSERTGHRDNRVFLLPCIDFPFSADTKKILVDVELV